MFKCAKATILILLLSTLSSSAISQSIDRYTVSSFGGTSISGPYQLKSNLGEPLVAHFQNDSVYAGQGFVQADSVGPLSVLENGIAYIDFYIFPNPAQYTMSIGSSGNKIFQGDIHGYNLSGVLIYRSVISTGAPMNINIQSWNEGVYFVKFVPRADEAIRNFKLIKL
jgi:hypothetical protein